MDLNKLNLAELTDEYNKRAKASGAKTVKRFRNKADAIKRIGKLETAPAKTKAKGKAKAEAKPNGGGRQPKVIDLPYNGPGKGEPAHKVREGSLGGQFVEQLRKGVTHAELVKTVEANDKATGKTAKDSVDTRVRSMLRMLHSYNGYGIKQNGESYKLVTK